MPDTPLNPDALDETALANLIAWKSLPFGATQFVKLDANAAHKVIELLRPHLAVAQPEVTSVESIPAQVQVISWEEEPEHECWKLAPDETFVGLIVKSDRAWSPADRYTLNIERPEATNGR